MRVQIPVRPLTKMIELILKKLNETASTFPDYSIIYVYVAALVSIGGRLLFLSLSHNNNGFIALIDRLTSSSTTSIDMTLLNDLTAKIIDSEIGKNLPLDQTVHDDHWIEFAWSIFSNFFSSQTEHIQFCVCALIMPLAKWFLEEVVGFDKILNRLLRNSYLEGKNNLKTTFVSLQDGGMFRNAISTWRLASRSRRIIWESIDNNTRRTSERFFLIDLPGFLRNSLLHSQTEMVAFRIFYHDFFFVLNDDNTWRIPNAAVRQTSMGNSSLAASQFLGIEGSSTVGPQVTPRMRNLSADASEFLEFIKGQKSQSLLTNDKERNLAIVFHGYDLIRKYNPHIVGFDCMVLADQSLPYLLFASTNNDVNLIIKVLNGEKIPIKCDVTAQQSMVQRNQITEANKFKSITITTVVTSNNFSALLVEAYNIQLLCNHIVKNHPKFRNEGSTLSDLVKAVLWNPLKSAYISTEGNDEAQKFFASRMKLVNDTTDNYLSLDNFSITPITPRKK
jgi:hypothetical protein